MRLRHAAKRRPRDVISDEAKRGFSDNECLIVHWLHANQGISGKALAAQWEVSPRTIWYVIRRGKDLFEAGRVPPLNVYMGGLGRPEISCDHPPIKVGDEWVCVRCCVSGFDSADRMQVTASDLARIEREEFEAALPKDAQGQPIYPQDPLKPFAQRKFGGRKEKQ